MLLRFEAGSGEHLVRSVFSEEPRARAPGPALVASDSSHQWVYHAAPFADARLAIVAYRGVCDDTVRTPPGYWRTGGVGARVSLEESSVSSNDLD